MSLQIRPLSILLLTAIGLSAVTHSATATVTVSVGHVTATPGSVVALPVVLDPDGVSVAGAQNDLSYDTTVLTLALRQGKPDCTVNPDIEKILGTTQIDDGAAVRAILLALTNVDPIPAGTLYTCNFLVAESAVPGTYTVSISRITVADPAGHALADVVGSDGSVTVPEAPPVSLDVGSATGMAGDTVSVTVSITGNGHAASGTQNDITIDPAALTVVTHDDTPACEINPATGKQLAATLLDSGTRLRVIVLSLDDVTAIPDGVLYTCTFSILATAASGTYPLVASDTVAADTAGHPIDSVGHDGTITVTHNLCSGDCNGDGAVTIDDLVKAVSIALDASDVSTCPAADIDHDGHVIITEVLTAVVNAQNGCLGAE